VNQIYLTKYNMKYKLLKDLPLAKAGMEVRIE
jgi:hypothetical protein